jgi:hypothetical protein
MNDELLILDHGTRPMPDPRPFVEVDAVDRPDIRDLARIIGQDGGSTARTYWQGAVTPSLSVCDVILNVEIHSPVRCSWGIRFSIPSYYPFLLEILDAGTLDVLIDGMDDGLAVAFPCGPLRGWIVYADRIADKLYIPKLNRRGA